MSSLSNDLYVKAPSPQEGASRRRNLIYIDSPVPACKAGLRGICRSNPSVGSNISLSHLHHFTVISQIDK